MNRLISRDLVLVDAVVDAASIKVMGPRYSKVNTRSPFPLATMHPSPPTSIHASLCTMMHRSPLLPALSIQLRGPNWTDPTLSGVPAHLAHAIS